MRVCTCVSVHVYTRLCLAMTYIPAFSSCLSVPFNRTSSCSWYTVWCAVGYDVCSWMWCLFIINYVYGV